MNSENKCENQCRDEGLQCFLVQPFISHTDKCTEKALTEISEDDLDTIKNSNCTGEGVMCYNSKNKHKIHSSSCREKALTAICNDDVLTKLDEGKEAITSSYRTNEKEVSPDDFKMKRKISHVTEKPTIPRKKTETSNNGNL